MIMFIIAYLIISAISVVASGLLVTMDTSTNLLPTYISTFLFGIIIFATIYLNGGI